MQKGLFSSLPSISNWPARTDLSAASVWAMHNGLSDDGDFAAVFRADDGAMLWCDGSGAEPGGIRNDPPEGIVATLAAVLASLSARCLIFARPPHTRALAALSVSLIPPICADSALFHGKQQVYADFGGRPLPDEATPLAALLSVPETRTLLIGNQGVVTVGPRVSSALSRLHRFERAADTHLRALATGHSLRLLPDELCMRQPEPDAEAFLATVKSRYSV